LVSSSNETLNEPDFLSPLQEFLMTQMYDIF